MASKRCRYCERIREHDPRYRVKPARHALSSTHPRCDIHWRFVCAKCGEGRHFHAIAFCPKRGEFFCLACAPEHRVDRPKFWGYPYAYRLRCPWRDE